MNIAGSSARGLRGDRSHWGATAAGGAIAIAAFVLVAPAVGQTFGNVTFSKPYSGTTTTYTIAYYGGCGGTSAVPISPFFNLTTGRATGEVKAAVRSCGATSSYATNSFDSGMESTSFSTTTGLHHLTVSWSVTFAIKLVATPGGVYQTAYASEEVLGYTALVDLTNHTTFYATNHPFQFNSTTSGTVAKNVTGYHLTFFVNGTLSSTHSYAFVAFIIGYTIVQVSTGTSSSSAILNMASKGNHATLTSVTLS